MSDVSRELPQTTAQPEAPTSSNNLFANISILLALGFLPLCMLMALVEAGSEIWRPFGVIFNVILLIVSVILLVRLLPNENAQRRIRGLEFNFAAVMMSSLIFVVGFSQTFRHLSFMIAGFTADQSGYWHWLRFGLANFLDAILFDWPTIYDWQLSEITANTGQTRFLVFTFRTLIEFIVVANIFRYGMILWKNRNEVAQEEPDTAGVFDFMWFVIEFVIFLLWAVPFTVMVGAMANGELNMESTWSALKIVPPVALGVWLVVIGLQRMWSIAFVRLMLVCALLGSALWLWIAFVPNPPVSMAQLQQLFATPMAHSITIAAIIGSVIFIIGGGILLWRQAPWRSLVAIMCASGGGWLIYLYWPIVVSFLKYLPQ